MRNGTGWTYEQPFTGWKTTVKCPECGARKVVDENFYHKMVLCTDECTKRYGTRMVKFFRLYREQHQINFRKVTVTNYNRLLRSGNLPVPYANHLQGV